MGNTPPLLPAPLSGVDVAEAEGSMRESLRRVSCGRTEGGVSRLKVVSALMTCWGSQVVNYHYQNFHVKLDYGVWPGKFRDFELSNVTGKAEEELRSNGINCTNR